MAQLAAQENRGNSRPPNARQVGIWFTPEEYALYDSLRGNMTHKAFVMRLVRSRPDSLVSKEQAEEMRGKIAVLEQERNAARERVAHLEEDRAELRKQIAEQDTQILQYMERDEKGQMNGFVYSILSSCRFRWTAKGMQVEVTPEAQQAILAEVFHTPNHPPSTR